MSDQDTKIIGLDLLQNPQKRKKSNRKPKPEAKEENKESKVMNKVDELTRFKLFMNGKLNEFRLPLENFEKSDPFKIHLASCYYHWKENRK